MKTLKDITDPAKLFDFKFAATSMVLGLSTALSLCRDEDYADYRRRLCGARPEPMRSGDRRQTVVLHTPLGNVPVVFEYDRDGELDLIRLGGGLREAKTLRRIVAALLGVPSRRVPRPNVNCAKGRRIAILIYEMAGVRDVSDIHLTAEHWRLPVPRKSHSSL